LKDSNNRHKVTVNKRNFILSLVLVVSLSVFLITSGPLSSSFLLSSPIKQVRAQQQPSSRPQQPTSQQQQPTSQQQQPTSQQANSSSQQANSSSHLPLLHHHLHKANHYQ
jgi:cytoskeletal protein RodZ